MERVIKIDDFWRFFVKKDILFENIIIKSNSGISMMKENSINYTEIKEFFQEKIMMNFFEYFCLYLSYLLKKDYEFSNYLNLNSVNPNINYPSSSTEDRKNELTDDELKLSEKLLSKFKFNLFISINYFYLIFMVIFYEISIISIVQIIFSICIIILQIRKMNNEEYNEEGFSHFWRNDLIVKIFLIILNYLSYFYSENCR